VEILELEQKYSELKSTLSELNFKRNKLLLLVDYFSLVLPNSSSSILEAYTIEFIPDFLSYIKSLEIRGLNPEVLFKLQLQLKTLRELNFANVSKDDLSSSSYALNEKLKVMGKWLNNDPLNKSDSKIYFPVLEKKERGFGNGYLESLNVQIKNGEQKFYITPSEYEGDEQLEKQITLCFTIAINYCKKFIRKIKPTHTIYLHFEDKLGMYSGNSIGIALTLIFIEAILKHYNSTIALNLNSRTAITGAIDNNSKIISTSKAIIEIKVETVFYSDAQIFCVPKIDEMWAEAKLKELQTEYPNRDLKIIGLTDLNDLLDRRKIVDIRKQKLIVRSGKFVKKNWISAVATVLLAILFAYLFVMDFDYIPAMFEQKGNLLNIQNKNGKVLWSTRLNFAPTISKVDRSKFSKKLVDINNDGVNEVLIAEEEIAPESYNFGRVACFNKDKKLIWEYFFRDDVSTFRKWTKTYSISILDTITISNQKLLLLMARNIPNFANAVFAVDILTGKRFEGTGTLWNAGAINNCIVGDFNEDGITELIIAGSHNGYERALLFSVNIDKMNGQTPAPDRYIFNNIPAAEINKFILLPHTDYGKHFWRSNSVPSQHLIFVQHSKEFELATLEGSDKPILFYYRFDKNLNFLWVDCADNAQQLRDTLVVRGVLNPPYTNTNEYFQLLKDAISYWDGKEFVKLD